MMEVFCFQLIASLIITKSSALSGILDRSGTPDELYSLLVSAIWDSLWDMLWPMRYATSYQLFVSIDMFYHISYGQSYELWVVYSVCMICHMRCNMSYIAIWGNISTGDPIQLPFTWYHGTYSNLSRILYHSWFSIHFYRQEVQQNPLDPCCNCRVH